MGPQNHLIQHWFGHCSTYSHPFQVTLPNPQTLSHKSSFIPRTTQLWNSLPPTIFQESYHLSYFKSNIKNLILSPSLLKLPILSVCPLSGLCYRPYGLSQTLLTKKNALLRYMSYEGNTSGNFEKTFWRYSLFCNALKRCLQRFVSGPDSQVQS